MQQNVVSLPALRSVCEQAPLTYAEDHRIVADSVRLSILRVNEYFTSNGSRNSTADVLMDGATVTNYEPNGGVTQITYVPSPEAVDEMRVVQSNFSAEYGFSGGSIVNMITRSGSMIRSIIFCLFALSSSLPSSQLAIAFFRLPSTSSWREIKR